MPVIELATVIRAPRERVFELARSNDAHRESAVGTGELAVAGVTSGLIRMGDEVTGEARHVGIRQRLTVRIIAFEPPSQFRDVMISGVFRSRAHDHVFEVHPEGTLMKERFEFRAPLGLFGRFEEGLVLTRYLRRFLVRPNAVLKQMAESGDWGGYVQQPHHGSGPA